MATVDLPYALPGAATLTLHWEADRGPTEAELLLLARLARDIESSQVVRAGESG